jgi:DNA-binding Lrp family transcriptional regulator
VTVFFRVSNRSLRALAEHLVGRSDVRLVALLTGRHGVLAEFIVPSLGDLERLLADDLAGVDATFETTTEPVLHEFKATVEWAHGLVAGVPEVRGAALDRSAQAEPQPLDEIDQALVDLLRRDGRTSFAVLGKAVGLSESAARRRFDALVQSRRIHPVTLVAGNVLGLDAQYFVSLNVMPAQIEHAARVLAARPEVRYLAATAGESDLFFELMLPAHPDLLRFRTEVLGALEGVTGVAIAMNVSTLKRAFLPSPRIAPAAAIDIGGGGGE